MKVGKAIYNILSQSTDVQSNFPFNTTDYTPTGTELIKNGSFADTTAGNIVLNPNFTDGVGEDWTVENNGPEGWTFENNYALGTANNFSNYLEQDFVITNGKSYKFTYKILQNSLNADAGAQFALSGYGGFRLNASTLWLDATVGTHTIYIIATNDDVDYALKFALSSTNTSGTIQLDNVSCELLGEDWTLASTGDGVTPTINSYGATISNGSLGDNSYVTQNIFITADKLYKVTYTIVSNANTNRLALQDYISPMVSTVGTHTEYITGVTGKPNALFKRYSATEANTSIVITGISVQEMTLTKIFPELAPPDVNAPYIVYSVVSNSPSETKNANGDIDTANIEVYGFQDTYNKAVDLGVSVRAALDRKTGTYNSIEIQSTNYVNEQMDVNEARKLWAAIQDYSIRIKNI